MPIDYRIDQDRRLVLANAQGVLVESDVFGYQREVWSRPEVEGYDELIDMSLVERIELPAVQRVEDLAKLSAAMDPPRHYSKFAIVATTNVSFGLGMMFKAYRELDPRSTKKVAVFRTMAEAMTWLGRPQ